LRYVVARFSAYRSLFAFEVMNEMDGVRAPFEVVGPWCESRARELHELDPHRHLVTTSYALRPFYGSPAAFASPEYDVAQTHAYGGKFEIAIPRDVEVLRAFGKPIL